jgi:hypothetical protein
MDSGSIAVDSFIVGFIAAHSRRMSDSFSPTMKQCIWQAIPSSSSAQSLCETKPFWGEPARGRASEKWRRTQAGGTACCARAVGRRGACGSGAAGGAAPR